MFRSNYIIDDKNNLSIQDTRLPVERVVEFRPINPTETQEDNAMRDQIIAELAKLGITVNTDISDADLLAKHSKALLEANKADDGEGELKDISEVVANAVKTAIEPLNTEISNLKTSITANADKELADLATQVVNSGKYPGLDEAKVKGLGLDTVKTMASNCGVSHSIGSTMHSNDDNSEVFKTNIDDLTE